MDCNENSSIESTSRSQWNLLIVREVGFVPLFDQKLIELAVSLRDLKRMLHDITFQKTFKFEVLI